MFPLVYEPILMELVEAVYFNFPSFGDKNDYHVKLIKPGGPQSKLRWFECLGGL